MAAISYDSREVLLHFANRVGVGIPLLSDPDSTIIRAFGILNTNIPPDNFRYGVPFPGTYIVDESGIVREKFFEHDLRERVTADTILTKEFGISGGRRVEIRTDHLTLTAYASQDTARRGNRITLILDVQLPPKMHIYAPDVEGYLPTSFSIRSNPVFTVHDPTFPKPEILDLPAIKERVPVYEGKLRVSRDITISPELRDAKQLEISGAFGYQACDDKICYTPRTVPLNFLIKLVPHDDERVPEALRRKER